MPLLKINENKLSICRLGNLESEKRLQSLVESNLETVFGSKFVATEFVTGSEHCGRIDTLALSEENNPVIIEYKKKESSDLINQSLFYLSWLEDHRGDFELIVQKALGFDQKVDWSTIRVICLAPGFKKYDLHAVKVMGANIELWQFRLYDNSLLYLDQIYGKQNSDFKRVTSQNVELASKSEIDSYTLDYHLSSKDSSILNLMNELRDFIFGLDDSIKELPNKLYIAYKTSQNFVCIRVYKNYIHLYLKLTVEDIEVMPKNARDVSNVGHWGTGDIEYKITSEADLSDAINLIKQAYEKIGG